MSEKQNMRGAWHCDRPNADVTVLIRTSAEQPLIVGFFDGDKWAREDGSLLTDADGAVLGWMDIDDAAMVLDLATEEEP